MKPATPEDIDEMNAFLEDLDADDDGTISEQELYEASQRLGMSVDILRRVYNVRPRQA